MFRNRFLRAGILVAIFATSIVFSQDQPQILARATGFEFTAADVAPNLSKAWLSQEKTFANAKTSMLARQIENILIENEAAQRKLTPKQLLKTEVFSKIPNPRDEEIKAIYEANNVDLGDRKLTAVRGQIIRYFRADAEKRLKQEFIGKLRAKYKIVFGKGITSENLVASDLLVSVGERQIRFEDFEKANGLVLYEYRADLFDKVLASLEESIDAKLIREEARLRGIGTHEIIAEEISSKMDRYSESERLRLYNEFRAKLYTKYRVRYLIEEPAPFVQEIATRNNPAIGDPKADITVVMFTDLQCPTCARVYPILKRVVKEYGERVYFVIRDFPLLQTHENAFRAAVAANAARAQGRFFEYKQLLYNNQDSLDNKSLGKYAREIGLDIKRFRRDIADPSFANEVQIDIADGENYGVNSTPTIFVNGIRIRKLSAEEFRKAIDRFIK